MRDLQSDNYIPGQAGWRISSDGTAEFQSGVFRGTIQAASGTIGGWEITSEGLQKVVSGGYIKIRVSPKVQIIVNDGTTDRVLIGEF
jgi:hypothetical protein